MEKPGIGLHDMRYTAEEKVLIRDIGETGCKLQRKDNGND
jgi:hypothetical protein